jgi:uncharacterized protein (TIGR03382 family)
VGCRQGDIHSTLYSLGTAQKAGTGAKVFNDITTGDNTFVDPQKMTITGFTAIPGYDLASGWGTLDVAKLVSSWPSCAVTEAKNGSCNCGSAPGETFLVWGPVGLVLLRKRRRS